jgi:hypothetical protein
MPWTAVGAPPRTAFMRTMPLGAAEMDGGQRRGVAVSRLVWLRLDEKEGAGHVGQSEFGPPLGLPALLGLSPALRMRPSA